MKIPALVGEPSAENKDIKNQTEDVNSYGINQHLKLDKAYIDANPKMNSQDIRFCRGYESLIETIDMCRKLSMSENSDYKLAVEKLKYCIDVNF